MTEQGPLSGQKLGDKYLLGDLLGQGGFGVVYQAQHVLLGRPQAIKILLEQHFASPKFRERFLREARTLAGLDHINILPVHGFGIEGTRAANGPAACRSTCKASTKSINANSSTTPAAPESAPREVRR